MSGGVIRPSGMGLSPLGRKSSQDTPKGEQKYNLRSKTPTDSRKANPEEVRVAERALRALTLGPDSNKGPKATLKKPVKRRRGLTLGKPAPAAPAALIAASAPVDDGVILDDYFKIPGEDYSERLTFLGQNLAFHLQDEGSPIEHDFIDNSIMTLKTCLHSVLTEKGVDNEDEDFLAHIKSALSPGTALTKTPLMEKLEEKGVLVDTTFMERLAQGLSNPHSLFVPLSMHAEMPFGVSTVSDEARTEQFSKLLAWFDTNPFESDRSVSELMSIHHLSALDVAELTASRTGGRAKVSPIIDRSVLSETNVPYPTLDMGDHYLIVTGGFHNTEGEYSPILGKGNFGKTVLGVSVTKEDSSDRKIVAVKSQKLSFGFSDLSLMMKENALHKMVQEHRNIVSMYRGGVSSSEHQFITELELCLGDLSVKEVSSEDKKDTFKQTLLKEPEAFKVLSKQLLSALSCMHEKGIAHRDIKPGNLLMGANGKEIKLADFGLATTSQGGLLKGTESYLPSWQGERQGLKTDVFSAGVTLAGLGLGIHVNDDRFGMSVLEQMTGLDTLLTELESYDVLDSLENTGTDLNDEDFKDLKDKITILKDSGMTFSEAKDRVAFIRPLMRKLTLKPATSRPSAATVLEAPFLSSAPDDYDFGYPSPGSETACGHSGRLSATVDILFPREDA
ncbi:hypothetical protein DID80_04505 [Candidatus Marinamargulisbacteria bacterium SCGC AAA071-K20]|nr:hypothetical protein DID80_04505 [Candidatus Marinamargulisbacteria bacterium SCGC AAA071-K20]